MKTILFDASLCNGCYGCQMACKDEHCGNDWSPIAAEQPTSGQFWCKVNQETRGKVPEVKPAAPKATPAAPKAEEAPKAAPASEAPKAEEVPKAETAAETKE